MSAGVVEALGLGPAARIPDLISGRQSFMPVHTGMQDVRIGSVLDLIHADPGLLPPRTGHLGNWGDIVRGRSGAMDFNTAVCGAGHGYPLVYGFNRTEAEAPGGDDVYLPGSLVDEGVRVPLSLYTFDGSRFVRRDRSQPLFSPLVRTELDGALVPLIEVHRRRLADQSDWRFAQWADGLLDNHQLMIEMLCVLFGDARAQPNPGRGLVELISQAARLDGTVGRCEMSVDGDGYLLDGYRYASDRELAEATMLPLRALSEPDWFFAHIAEFPPVLPVLSLLLTNVLFAVLGVHRPGEKGVPDEGPFITHLHWGARAMAGCPPRRNGYFGRRSRVRPMRTVTTPLVRHFAQIKPICFVLLPATAFMLCPPDTLPADAELMGRLVRKVATAAPDTAYETALAELDRYGSSFSDYVAGRFDEGSGLPRDGRHRPPAVPVEPEGFRELTFRQACAIVAAFERVREGCAG